MPAPRVKPSRRFRMDLAMVRVSVVGFCIALAFCFAYQALSNSNAAGPRWRDLKSLQKPLPLTIRHHVIPKAHQVGAVRSADATPRGACWARHVLPLFDARQRVSDRQPGRSIMKAK